MIVTLIQKSEDSEQRSDIEDQTDNHFDPAILAKLKIRNYLTIKYQVWLLTSALACARQVELDFYVFFVIDTRELEAK